jgi:hypothetical protein
MKKTENTKYKGEIIFFYNEGRDISDTNYKHTHWNKQGKFMLSAHDKTLRLICPTNHFKEIQEMKTANKVLVSYGINLQYRRPMIEVLFEDDSPFPFVLQMSTEQSVCAFWTAHIRNPFSFTVWSVVNGWRTFLDNSHPFTTDQTYW